MDRTAALHAGVAVFAAVWIGVIGGCDSRKAPPTGGPAQQQARSATTRPRVAAAPAKDVPVVIKLPRPVCERVHYPRNTTAPPLSYEPRPVWMAPAGTVLLSLNKPVTSSDPQPAVGQLDMVTDGDKEATDASVVELAAGLQWVQIDLQKQATIYGLAVWHNHKGACAFRDVVIQISDDPDFIKGVQTVYNNDQDNSAGLGRGKDREFYESYEGQLILVDKLCDNDGQTTPVKGVQGRYVRFYSKGSTFGEENHYTEIEVYGVAPK